MSRQNKDSAVLKATLEFGSEYIYTLKNGGLGPTLVVDAQSKKLANIARKKIPSTWEGLYTIVVYTNTPDEAEVDNLSLGLQEELPV